MPIQTERTETVGDPSVQDASPPSHLISDAGVQPVGSTSVGMLGDRSASLGRYVLLERLGAGAMGVVYAAHDPQLDRRVAVKLLHGTELDVPRAQRRLLREARALAKLSHPNVVAVHDVDSVEIEGDGEIASLQVFIAMELVDGETLRQWLERGDHSPAQVLALFVQAARGLAAAHAAGIVHRDFKPDNVLVDREGRARVMDFGLARATGGLATTAVTRVALELDRGSPLDQASVVTRRGSVVGTPVYMAPEQHLGGAIDARADQFAFCVALWEALFCERPFAGKVRHELAEAVTLGRLREPSARRGVTPRIRRALERGLASEPEQRWPDMGSLIAVLAETPSPRWRPIAAVAAAGALALVVARMDGAGSDCEDRDARLGDAWNETTREAVRTSLLATGVSYAADTWTRSEAGLDAYADTWMRVQRAACEGADAQLSDALRTARVLCIDDRKRALAALVAVLSQSDQASVEHAAEAVGSLPRVEPCEDLEYLAAAVEPPTDPEAAARVREQRGELDRSRALDHAGAYADGLAVADSVVEQAEALGYRPLVAEALLQRGELEEGLGRFDAAEASLQRAYFDAVASGHDDVAAAAATGLVVVVGQRLARHVEGLQWGVHADAQIQRLGTGGEREADLLVRLGSVHDLRGEYDEALSSYRRALAITEELLGPSHANVGNIFAHIGSAQRERGDYEAAVTDLRRAVEVLEQALGPEHPRIAGVLNALGTVRMLQGEYDEALALYRRASAIAERSLGADHPSVGVSLHGMGVVLVKRGEYEDGREHFQRAIELRERALGADHIDVAQSLVGIGNAEFAQGHWDPALAHFQRALAICERTLGANHPQLTGPLNNIASIENLRGDAVGALAHYRRALAIAEQALGPEHPMVASTLNNIAGIHSARAEYDEALACHLRALAIREKALGPTHTSVMMSLGNVGNVYSQRGDDDLALEYYERALALPIEAPTHDDLLHNLGLLRISRGEPDLAIAVLEQALAAREQRGVAIEDIEDSRFGLARALWESRRDRPRGRALAEQASETLRVAGAIGVTREEIDAWLRKIGRGRAR
jgi:eukaryotic-like serine/threonine-protein kinase